MSDRKTSKNRLATLAVVLKELKISKVVIEYDGVGDSGQIENVFAFDSKGKIIDIPEIQVDVSTPVSKQNKKGKWVTETVDEKVSLNDALQTFCEDHLDDIGIDWQNNSGGFGTQTINVEECTAKLSHSYRVETTTDEEYDI